MNNFFIDFKAAKILSGAFLTQDTVNISKNFQNLNTAISEGNMDFSNFFSLKNNQ